MQHQSKSTKRSNSKSSQAPVVLVDGTNLDHCIRESFGRSDIHYRKFFQKLACGRQPGRVDYYCARYRTLGGTMRVKQDADLKRLRRMSSVKIHFGRHMRRTVTCFACGKEHNTYQEKGTDIGLACGLMRVAYRRSAKGLVLVSNDTDFAPAVEVCRNEGIHVTLAVILSPHEHPATQLERMQPVSRHARKVLAIDSAFMTDCWQNKPKTGGLSRTSNQNSPANLKLRPNALATAG